MPRPRRLSGDDVLAILVQHGFNVHSQRGSHVKLRRVTSAGSIQTLTIPRHRELDPGTLHAIFRQASRFVPEDELHRDFFTE
ncbi:MAG: type II toxin-antitoxin system HicA family toxin [Chloroflexi bacterium]|nr:type II toxin-antitoxin system HicA family toxin [Chloroflexota bacterium]